MESCVDLDGFLTPAVAIERYAVEIAVGGVSAAESAVSYSYRRLIDRVVDFDFATARHMSGARQGDFGVR
jgi:hypothetical protein